MRKNLIGQQEASAIGLGCMRIADLTARDTRRWIDAALETGINLFDHADIYGGGSCESLFGECLREEPSLRKKIVVQSKCGIRQGYYDLSKEYILRSVEEILKRLHTEYLDLFILHRPDTLMQPEEIAEAFDKLYADGKARSFGVSNMNPGQIELLQSATPHRLAVNQLQFSLVRTGMVDSGLNANVPCGGDARDEGVLEYCRLHGITIQTWSPLQYGFFQGVFIGCDKYPKLNKELAFLAEQYGVDPATIAIAWILTHPANMQVILGSSNAERIKRMAKAGDVRLTRKEWYGLYCAAGNVLP